MTAGILSVQVRPCVWLVGLTFVVLACSESPSVATPPLPDVSTSLDVTARDKELLDAPDAGALDALSDAPSAPPTDGVSEVGMGCASNVDCASRPGATVCDRTTGECVRCTAVDDACPPAEHCDEATRTCVPGCHADEGCRTTSGGSLYCYVPTRACVACLRSEHCPTNHICVNNNCVPGCEPDRGCGAGQTCCERTCADLMSNPAHCGMCGDACTAGPNATAICVMGACRLVCSDGFADCDARADDGCEVDTRASDLHCGGCGRACAPGTRCEMGTCRVVCDAPRTLCTGACVDTQSDAAHCGMCGRACATGERCVGGVCVAPLPTSCAVILRRDPTARDGTYMIAPAGAALMARCDMTTGRGYTFLLGGSVGANSDAILGACPDAGTAPFEVRSEAHAAALRRYVVSPTPTGRWYWANFFAGPRVDCPTLANRGGWLRAPTDWVDANVAPAALLPLTMNENCNNMNQFDPIPLNDRQGYHNRHCEGCGVLLNRTEGTYPGTVVCSVNDVPACPTGTDDCNGVVSDGCETDLRTDAMHCGRCRNACRGGMVCTAGACQPPCAAPRMTCGGACVDTRTDNANCGGCGRVCAGICVGGTCATDCRVASRGGRQYLFCTRYITRDAGRAVCQSWGGDLVAVEDEAEHRFLNDTARGIDVNAMWWVGANDLATECGTDPNCANWRNADGSPTTYRPFCPGEPSELHRNECSPAVGEDCVHMRWFPYRAGSSYEGCWNDIPCDCPSDGRTGLTTYLICERGG